MVLTACFCLFLFVAFTTPQDPIVGAYLLTVESPEGTLEAKMVFAEDGTYTVDLGNDGEIEVKGKYTYEDGKVTVEDTEGVRACDPGQIGVYTITMDEETMTMNRVSDDCPGRGTIEMVFKRL